MLGFCGRLVPRKHPEYVQWMLTEPGFETRGVLIAGRGFSPYARDLLARHALAGRVRFLGWCAGARLEAFFDRDDMELGYTVFKRGDRFVETYYDDRWYNVFAVYDRDDGGLMGWYCNICRPAVISL